VKKICAWCGKDMGEKPSLDDDRISHGICPECVERELEEIGSLDEVERREV